MTFYEIMHYVPINPVDEGHVLEIMESMKENGFVGCPILVTNDGSLFTGCHRLEALRRLAEEDDEVFDWDVAEDITDIINEKINELTEIGEWDPVYDHIEYDRIGQWLEGSWVEEYKDEIAEW